MCVQKEAEHLHSLLQPIGAGPTKHVLVGGAINEDVGVVQHMPRVRVGTGRRRPRRQVKEKPPYVARRMDPVEPPRQRGGLPLPDLGRSERVPGEVLESEKFLVEDREEQVETAQKFDEPLVDQRFRHEDEDAPGETGEMEAVQDEAGLDGFSKPHLIG